MKKIIDLTGQKFGRLTVIQFMGRDRSQKLLWKCVCDCPAHKEVIVRGNDLRRDKIKSCGCIRKELQSKRAIERSTKHNLSETRLYRVWSNMKTRCYNPADKGYKHYGNRGITVCDEWLHDFRAFYDWAMASGYDENAPRGECTIDRIDNNKGYSPENCRWVGIEVQNANKRDVCRVQYEGREYTIAQLSERLKVAAPTLLQRVKNGWTEQELILPPNKNNKNIRRFKRRVK